MTYQTFIASRIASRLHVACLLAGLFSAVLATTASGQPGQPRLAPVPDAVAMTRPGEEELARARDLLAAFTESLDGQDRALVDAYPWLIEVRPPAPFNTAIVPALNPRFEARHQENLAVAAAGDIDVLFMGDSITDWWRTESGRYAGKPVFDRVFGDWKVANFGIAGDTTQGVLYRLQNGEGEGFSPKAVMLMIGTNNTRTHVADEIAEGVGAIVLELQSRFPAAKILLLGVFPRGSHDDPRRAQIARINAIISRLHDGSRVQYLDIGNIFLDANGDIPVEIMSDGLHPTTRGYELWADAVIGPLTGMLE